MVDLGQKCPEKDKMSSILVLIVLKSIGPETTEQ